MQTDTTNKTNETSVPSDRGTAFKPVSAGEATSGETLLIEAYAAMWLVAFFLILLSWRRQRATDERIAALEGAVAAARRGATEAASKAISAKKASAKASKVKPSTASSAARDDEDEEDD